MTEAERADLIRRCLASGMSTPMAEEFIADTIELQERRAAALARTTAEQAREDSGDDRG